MPWYYGWNILSVGILFQAVSFGIGIYSFTFWVLPWVDDFGVGRGAVMTTYIGLQIAMGAASPFAGRAMDSLSIRVLVSVGAVCLAAGLVLAARATALWQIGLIYATLMPAGMLLAGPLAAQTLAAKWFSARRGLAIGLVTIGTSLGGFFIPPLVTGLQAAFGWREANLWLALLVVIAIVPPTWFVVRNTPGQRGVSDHAEFPTTPDAGGATFPDWSTKEVLSTRIFWVMVCAFTPLAIAFGAAQQNLAPYAADQGFDTLATSYLVSVMALVMVGAKIFFGAMADRWSHRWLFMGAIAAVGGALALLGDGASYNQLVVMSVLLGFSAGAFLPMMGAIISRWFGAAAFGRVMGLVGPFTTLAATGPWLAGYVRDTTGSYDLAWVILSFVLLISVAATWLLRSAPER